MAKSFKIFYDHFSPLSRSLLILFERNNVECEKISVALRKGEHLSEEFGDKINRFHKVPVIHDSDGFRLAESIAIFHYLGRRGIFEERWYPKNDIKKLSQIDEFMQWHHNSLAFSAASIFYNAWIKPIREINMLEHGMMRNVRDPLNYVDIDNSLDLLENTWLKENKFIVGEEPTFAEILASCTLMQVIGLRLFRLDEQKYQKVTKWLNATKSYFNPEFDELHKYIYKYGEKFNGKSPFEN
ncbi:hypothetical protein PVAND_013890 [Polypedilum vanderplanki]|uniref:Glutathione S-transferase n=1 Tax=Polypedilum vanderplanki TaxID=319348 RepID=A0A9J6CR28_POLVA|nr:hypothetical protein PVAND_013890 [Polypedilum vanderplanki]